VAKSSSKHSDPGATLDEIESWGERAIEWIGNNARAVLGAAVVLLILAAGYGYWSSSRGRAESAAAEALETARADYLAAMGAAPGAVEVPELANPSAGEAIREEYIERFRQVADEHPGTAGAALAQLEQGNLVAATGDVDAALTVWHEAVAALPGDAALAGLLQQRMGQALEAREDWQAAAEAYESASAVPDYTFRYWAMADAARCYALADRPERAVALYVELEQEAPDFEITDYLRTRLRELQATLQN
jgi:tetratricopeptide (TPR) repeat protein